MLAMLFVSRMIKDVSRGTRRYGITKGRANDGTSMPSINKDSLGLTIIVLASLIIVAGIACIVIGLSDVRSASELLHTLSLQYLDFIQTYNAFFPVGIGLVLIGFALLMVSPIKERLWVKVFNVLLLVISGCIMVLATMIGTKGGA